VLSPKRKRMVLSCAICRRRGAGSLRSSSASVSGAQGRSIQRSRPCSSKSRLFHRCAGVFGKSLVDLPAQVKCFDFVGRRGTTVRIAPEPAFPVRGQLEIVAAKPGETEGIGDTRPRHARAEMRVRVDESPVPAESRGHRGLGNHVLAFLLHEFREPICPSTRCQARTVCLGRSQTSFTTASRRGSMAIVAGCLAVITSRKGTWI